MMLAQFSNKGNEKTLYTSPRANVVEICSQASILQGSASVSFGGDDTLKPGDDSVWK